MTAARIIFCLLVASRAVHAGCDAWCGQYTCLQPPCFDCDICVSAISPPSSLPVTDVLSEFVAPQKQDHHFHTTMCIGSVWVRNTGMFHVVRNTGGGSSNCCRAHPVAAGAAIDQSRRSIALELQPLQIGQQSRNGARIYLANDCVEGHYKNSHYTAFDLLGRSISFTIDLSTAGCGCNAAFYLVSMKQNHIPGVCDGDFYCDAMQVCGASCQTLRWVLCHLLGTDCFASLFQPLRCWMCRDRPHGGQCTRVHCHSSCKKRRCRQGQRFGWLCWCSVLHDRIWHWRKYN